MKWKEYTWGEVLEIRNGKNQKKVENPEGMYPIYGSGGIMGRSDDYLCEAGSTIIGRKGSINNPIYVSEKYWNVDTAFGLHPGAELDNKFFYYFCTTYDFFKHNKAVTIPSLTKTDLLKIKIPLPPLETQKKIAAILDAADDYRQKTKALIEKYDELSQSLFLEMFGDPVRNPKGWATRNIRKSCNKFCDGPFGSNLKSEHYVDNGIRVIRLKNIGVGDFIDKDKAYITDEHAASLKNNHCLSGDILIGTMGEPNLRACILPESIPLAINKADCLICRPKLDIFNPIYLTFLLNNKSFVNSLEDLILGQTRGRISMGRLATKDIVSPPITLQNQFASHIQKIEAQKAQAQHSLEKAEELFNSLLQRAFKGELV